MLADRRAGALLAPVTSIFCIRTPLKASLTASLLAPNSPRERIQVLDSSQR